MSELTVTAKIEEKANAMALSILEEAKVKVASIKESQKKEAEKAILGIKEKAEAKAELAYRSVIQKAKLDEKIEILATKKLILEDIGNNAVRALAEIGDDEYSLIFKNLIASSDIKGDAKVLFGSLDNGRKEKTFAKLNEIEGIKLTLTDESAPFEHGIMLCLDKYDVEFSFENIIESVVSDNEKEIAEILFEGE